MKNDLMVVNDELTDVGLSAVQVKLEEVQMTAEAYGNCCRINLTESF